MKINRITLYEAPIPLKEPFTISLGSFTHANNVFVRVTTTTGLVGWGEASPFPSIHGETMLGCITIGKYLAAQLLRRDPCRIQGVVARMDKALHGNSCIKSAIEIACHDVLAQAKRLPLYRVLGADRARAIATDYTISLGSTEEMIRKALWIKGQGFPVIKVKLGEGLADVDRVKQIRKTVGPEVPLRLDANQGWTVPHAIQILSQLSDLNVQHCEEPIDKRDWHDLTEIRRHTTIPIFADESCWDHHDARRLVNYGAVDGLNVKLSKSGGFTKALKIHRLAREAGLPLQVGGFLETRLGFTAAAHFGMLPEVIYHDLDTPLMQTVDPIIGGIRYGEYGRITLTEAVGLGAEPAPDFLSTLKKHVVYERIR